MIGRADLIECAKGVQVEIALACTWTLYSKVYRDEEAARKAGKQLAGRLGLELHWGEAGRAEG